MTGISKPTISDAAERLMNAGIIVNLGQQIPPEGRPVQLYGVNADYGYSVGVSIERGHVAVRALDFAGAVKQEDRADTEAGDSVSAALTRAANMLRSIDAAITSPRLATAVAVAAPIDPATSTIIGWPNSPFPDGIAVLGTALGIPDDQLMRVDNDVNWAALAEHRIGSTGDASDFLYIYLGAGVGAGLFLSGQVYRGSRGLAGEIAFTRMEDGGILAHKLARSVIGTHDGWGGSIHTVRAIEMFNDPALRESLQPVVDDIAWVITNVATVIDPSRIVIGGPLSQAAPLIEALNTHVRLPSKAGVPITASALGRDAPLYGAALGALELARRECTSCVRSETQTGT